MPVSARVVNVEHDYKVNKNMLEYVIIVQTSENIAKVDSLSKAEAEQLIKDQNNPKDGEEPVPQNPEKRPINDIRNEFQNNENDSDKKDSEENQ